MNGPTILENGDVISSALSVGGYANGQSSIFENFSIQRGQIIKIYTVDDPNNTSQGPGTFTVYDVNIFMPNGAEEIIRRCFPLHPLFAGQFNNFFEVIPNDPGPAALDSTKNGNLKRGTYVLVGFIGGKKTNAVILGSLPHPSPVAVKRRPKKELGSHLEGEFQGLNWFIKNDGSIKVIFNGPRDDSGKIIGEDGPTTLEIDAKGNFEITTNSEQSVTVDRVNKEVRIVNGTTLWKSEQNGSRIYAESDFFEVKARKDVTVHADGTAHVHSKGTSTVSSDTMIKLQKGHADPAQPFVLGKIFVAMMKRFLNAVITHRHVGNLGFPTDMPINAGEFQAILSDPISNEEVLSKHIIGT
jgi:hypothetical protein